MSTRWTQAWIVVASVVVFVACGATTRGSPDENSGGNPRQIDGVPIGDCKLLESQPEGCPEDVPGERYGCQAPAEPKRCSYGITAQDGRARQRVAECSPYSLTWSLFDEVCGYTCGAPSTGATNLTEACAERPLVGCKNSDGAFAFETAQQRIDEAFAALVTSCAGGRSDLECMLHVDIEGGCPTRLSHNFGLTAAEVECVAEALRSVHWDCAENLACVSFSQILL